MSAAAAGPPPPGPAGHDDGPVDDASSQPTRQCVRCKNSYTLDHFQSRRNKRIPALTDRCLAGHAVRMLIVRQLVGYVLLLLIVRVLLTTR
jgi:hypothetical protein